MAQSTLPAFILRDLSEEDAWYSERHQLVGRTFIPDMTTSPTLRLKDSGWYYVDGYRLAEPTEAEVTEEPYVFYKARIQLLGDEEA